MFLSWSLLLPLALVFVVFACGLLSAFLASVFLPASGAVDACALGSALPRFGLTAGCGSSDSVVAGWLAGAAGCGARGRAAVRRRTAPGRSSTMAVMWLVRLKMLKRRPMARGWPRFNIGPGSTRMSLITRSSRTRLKLFSAFACAERITLATSRAADLGMNEQATSASDTGRLRSVRATSRTLRGEVLTHLAFACTSMIT